jgi:hypothetical protein
MRVFGFMKYAASTSRASLFPTCVIFILSLHESGNRLCRELPASTTISERFALMAEEDCAEKGNPLSVTLEELQQMTTAMNMNPRTFECFHRPDPSI